MESLRDWAIQYASEGLKVLPLQPGTKEPLKNSHGVNDATNDIARITKIWTDNPNYNIGLATGKTNSIIGIDVDYKDGARKSFESEIPRTYRTRTANGGLHPYYRYPDKGIKNNKKIELGITVRADGYYLVAPPSVLSNGKQYECYDDPIWKWIGNLPECPEWLIDCPEWKPHKLNGNGVVPVGMRHDSLRDKAVSMRKRGKDESEIAKKLFAMNLEFPGGPKEAGEVLNIIKWTMDNVTPDSPHQSNLTPSEMEIVNTPFPDENEKTFKRLGTERNVRELLRRLKVKVRYNVISKKREILIPNLVASIDNLDNVSFAKVLDWCNRTKIPTEALQVYLLSIADENLYNPVASWIESVPWDGKSRLEEFYATVTSPDKLKDKLLRAWMIEAVAAVFEPDGIAPRGVLVFQSKQYLGKTMWFRSLCDAEYRADGEILRPDNKDDVLRIVSKWLIELGELDATFKKSEIAQLKAFLSKNRDVIRRPYAKDDSNYPRRTVFFASVNEEKFLSDPTGNTRFWTIQCTEINHNHGIDMQQVWAEFLQIYRTGEIWYLTNEVMNELNEHNKDFEEVDPMEEKLRMLDWSPGARRSVTATEICEELGIKNPTQRDTRRVARAVFNISGQKSHKSNGQKLFFIPYHTFKF